MVACGQESLAWPEEDAGTCNSSCGNWYPPPAGEGDQADYAIEEGKTISCLVWEQVLQDDRPTYLNLGDLYLQAKHVDDGPRKLLILVSARNCPQCKDMIEKMLEVRDRFESSGTVMISAAASDIQVPSVHLTLEEADLLLDEEGWPKAWYRTNDAEMHLEDFYNPAPWTIVVDLKDMKVLTAAWDRFSATNVEDLLDLLEKD